MTVKIAWDNPQQTILRYTFSGDWTWEEYLEQLRIGRDWMRDITHMVCIINDMRSITHLPTSFVATAHSVITTRPQNTGIAVFIANTNQFKSAYRMIVQTVPDIKDSYLLVETEADAYKQISAWLSSLDQP